MKSFIRLSLLLLVSTAFITSCKKAVPAQTKYIPKSAVFVATINIKSLQNKLAQNQGTIENIIRNVSGSDTSINKGKQEMEDLKSSGLDLEDNLYVSVLQKGGGMTSGKGITITSVIGTLKDADKLVAYIKKKQPDVEVTKEKEYSYTTVHGDNLVAWNKDVVMLMSYQKTFSTSDMAYDSATGSFNLQNPAASKTDMKAELESDFNLKEDQSIAAIPEFRDLMQEKSDASTWINSSNSMEGVSLPLPNVKELLSNNVIATTVNFEDGQITLASKSYFSQQLKDLLKQYTGPTADLSLIENYPSNNINGFAAFSFNPEVFNGLVKNLELGAFVDTYLSKMMGSNYALEDALKAIKGDFALIVSDFTGKARTDTTRMRGGIPNVKMILNIPVGDKVQMNRLLDKLVERQMLVKINNQYRLNQELQRIGFQLIADDKNLFITSDENLLNQYKSKSIKANLNKDVMSDFKDKSAVGYVNIESVLNGITSGSDTVTEVLSKAKETFRDMEGYAENFNGKFVEWHGKMRFKNEKQNSLTSLLQFIETASKYAKRGTAVADDDNDVKADRSVVAPPVESK